MAVIEGAMGLLTYAGVPGAATNEVQTITIGGTPTGGTFTLTFQSGTTEPITWVNVNATLVTAVDTALKALSNIETGDITTAVGTMTAGIGTITVTFGGVLAGQDVGAMTATSSLTGTAPTVSVATTTPGVAVGGKGASKGQLLVDTTNGVLYINTGTGAAPVWTKVGTQT
jgi:hypothetical protein